MGVLCIFIISVFKKEEFFMQKSQFDKNGKKVGYLVHLAPSYDNSIDLYLESRVVIPLLIETTGLTVGGYLSYKDNPKCAEYFIEKLKKDQIDTIVVHDIEIFNRDIIDLFIQKGFHFIVVEIDEFNSKYCIFEIENNGNKIDAFTVYSKRTNAQWHRLKTKYKKAIGRNKILARNLNNIYEQFGL
jgi:hypothetical protein